MDAVDIGRRFVQLFWDPEPTNDAIRDLPVWCLGCSYTVASAAASSTSPNSKEEIAGADAPPPATDPPQSTTKSPSVPPPNAPDTPPESISSSFSSSLAYEEPGDDRGWPPAFLDDFESRFWMTYRSDFEPIPQSTDPRAASSLSLTMRIKSQLIDQRGFTSDSGWGCMIRTGQSLLANTMAMHRLGRGKWYHPT
jgi:cysteine protease ATG4